MSDLMQTLGIKIISVKSDQSIISLEISEGIKQPYGLVHGGINAVLAETAASLAGEQNVPAGSHVAGVALTTHHLRPAKMGTLRATATPLHIGRNIQTWQVEVKNGEVLTSVSEVTLSRVGK